MYPSSNYFGLFIPVLTDKLLTMYSFKNSSARSNFIVKQTRTRLDQLAFPVTGVKAWSSLPAYLKDMQTNDRLYRQLEAYKFG